MCFKGLIFDFGGTLDVPGRHWSDVIYDAYSEAGCEVCHAAFFDAYVFAERALALPGAVPQDCTFSDLMERKIAFELQHLVSHGVVPEIVARRVGARIVEDCYRQAREGAVESADALRTLAEKYPMCVVSNFYGNLSCVLNEFGLDGFFRAVVDSAIVGIRKPDSRIFHIGAARLGLSPRQIIVVGDSVEKDICPAASDGFGTALLLPGVKTDKMLPEGCKIIEKISELADAEF